MTRMSAKAYREWLARGDGGPPAARREAGALAQSNGASWESTVEDLLELGGWIWDHARPMEDKNGNWRTPLSGHKGGCDYKAVHPTRHLFIMFETKSGSAVVSPDQKKWIDALRAAQVPTYVWRPEDIDEVKALLLGPLLRSG